MNPAAGTPAWLFKLRLSLSGARRTWSLLLRNRLGLLGVGAVGFFALLAAIHPLLLSTLWDPRVYDPVTGRSIQPVLHPAGPSSAHLLGTDALGRDVLSQVMMGARTAFALGLTTALITVFIATLVGALSAYAGGWVDGLLMRLADLFLMLPAVSVLIVLGALFELHLLALALVLGLLAGLGATAIVLRSRALAVKERGFVAAAEVAGCSGARVLFVHIIPALMPLAFLYMMFTVTAAVFAEAVLSYLGLLDVRMSWGIMLNGAEAGGYLLTGLRHWWLTVTPGLCVTVLCGSFYLIGRGFDEVVDPRLRNR